MILAEDRGETKRAREGEGCALAETAGGTSVVGSFLGDEEGWWRCSWGGCFLFAGSDDFDDFEERNNNPSVQIAHASERT